ncbi:UvrD-helicase domain-containing protein, partial [Candidatus Dojkabacteria bacterium]|nr:UvrD-helicase domain-containing protein [Candidatus Dojkabacteria bacterium]
NYAQYVLIKYLVNEEHNNLCVVGDEDQSIYKFRGATIDNILNFENDYENAKVIKLEQNYRSTKNILEAAHEVIKSNTERKEKKLWTEKESGPKITIYKASDENDEGFFIAGRIIELDENEEVAVLYRTNGQSRSLEEVFLRFKIPYKLVGGTRFYDRKEIKDTLAYLKLAYNINDNLSLKRIINVPSRKIGAKTVKEIELKAQSADQSMGEFLLENSEKLPSQIKKFAQIMESILSAKSEMNIYDLINFVLKRSDYLKFLDDGTEEGDSRVENLKELLTVALNYTELEPEESLEKFLEDVSLIEQEQAADQTDTTQAKVTLMTIHASKGLEFDHVFVSGMEESLFPHSRSYMDPSELEEERRLAYVAITRAKKALYLSHAYQRTIWGRPMQNPVSRFLLDIPEELIEKEGFHLESKPSFEIEDESLDNDYDLDLKPGDKVYHEIFKTGRVISTESDMLIINFESPAGIKKLAPEFAKVKKI